MLVNDRHTLSFNFTSPKKNVFAAYRLTLVVSSDPDDCVLYVAHTDHQRPSPVDFCFKRCHSILAEVSAASRVYETF